MHFIDKMDFAWTGDFECLKQFTKEFLKSHGDWSQPGGDKKVFACNYLTMTWRKSKQVKKSDEVKRQICDASRKCFETTQVWGNHCRLKRA